MNPYHQGCLHNVLEIFCSKIPASKNNFRDKAKFDPSSAFNHTMSYRNTTSPSMSKSSPDVSKSSPDPDKGKRHAVAAEDLEEIHNQIANVAGTERSGTVSSNVKHGRRDSNWEITDDMKVLAAEFGMQYGPSPRQSNSTNLPQ